MAACGWRAVVAPALGERAAQVTRGTGASTETALLLTAEGVTVLLVGSGGVPSDALRWESLADVALGSSCPAAPDGCH
jgi:hypothetical protein